MRYIIAAVIILYSAGVGYADMLTTGAGAFGGASGPQGSEVLADSGNTELLADPTNAYILTQ